MIVINDGCRDPIIIKRLEWLAGRDRSQHRIRIVHLPKNRGLPHARNLGFRIAAADYVYLLDSDDLIEPTTLEKLLWTLHSSPSLGFASGFTVGFGFNNYTWESGFHEASLFLRENRVTPASLVRKSTHTYVGGFTESDVHGLEDWDFWLKAANSGFWGTTVPEYLDWYRTRPHQVDDWAALQDLDLAVDKFRSRYPKLYTNYSSIRVAHSHHVAQNLVGQNVVPRQQETKRVLMMIPWMRVGGVDKHTLDLVKLFDSNGWDVTIVATIPWKPEPFLPQEWEVSFKAITEDTHILSNFLHSDRDKLDFLSYLMLSRQPDIVFITGSELGYVFLPLLHHVAAQMPQKPVIVDYVHMIEGNWRNGGYASYSVEYRHYISQTLTSSEHVKKWLTAHGARKSKVSPCYIGPGFDIEADRGLFQVVRSQLGIDDDSAPVILYAARLVEQKQPHVFAQVIDRLRHGFDFTAVVVGDGPLRAELQHNMTTTMTNSTGRIFFFPSASPSEMINFLQASDIVFLPSANEGIALIAYEAMALGKVFVGAAVGGQPELIPKHCECGVLITPSTNVSQQVDEYVVLLQKLVANPALRSRLGKNAAQRVSQQFSSLQMFQCVLKHSMRKSRFTIRHLSRESALEMSLRGVAAMSSWARDP